MINNSGYLPFYIVIVLEPPNIDNPLWGFLILINTGQ